MKVANTRTAATRRKGYHHGNLKEVLITAALSLARQHGARSLSLREVARLAGVSHSASYRHFPNKESLLATIAELGFIELAEALSSAAKAAPGNALDKLAACGMAYVEYGVSHPEQINIMFGDAIQSLDSHESLIQSGMQAYQVLIDQVVLGQQQGCIRMLPVPLVALNAWCLVHGLATLVIGGKIPPINNNAIDHQGIARQLTLQLYSGIANYK